MKTKSQSTSPPATREKQVWHLIALLGVLCIGLVMMGKFAAASLESSTYNRLTGAETTAWDALWVELRVYEPVVHAPGFVENTAR